jgi:hypothetical protein
MKTIEEILNSFSEDIDSYVECKRIVSELELIGFTADYYLDGEIFNVRKL